MASAATICSTFDFTLHPDGLGAYTLANPGRTFRVQQVLINGVDGGSYVITVRKNTGAGALVGTLTPGGAGNLVDMPVPLTEANTRFGATDNIYIVFTGGINDTAAKTVVRCIGDPAQVVTLS